MVVELRMQLCGKHFLESFETYKTFLRRIISEFKCRVDVKDHQFGWLRFKNCFLIIKY